MIQDHRIKSYNEDSNEYFGSVMRKDLSKITSVPKEVVDPKIVGKLANMRTRQIKRQIAQHCEI